MLASLYRKSKFQIWSTRFSFQWQRIRKHGLLGIAQRICKRLLILLLSIILLPISIALYACNYRRLCIFTDRIGHLAIEPDTLLKAQLLGLIVPRRWIVVAPIKRVANQHLLTYWKPHFLIYQSPVSCFFLECLTFWRFMRYEASHFINSDDGSQYAYAVNSKWGSLRPAILTLTDEDNKFAAEKLSAMGVPKDAWFVCVHAREGGFSPIDEPLHSHRNTQIDNLIPAIQEITKRGGWVIRLGDPTTMPLNQMPQVVDYAHHELRSGKMDVILCAKAKFILGNTSGIFLVGSVFGTPSALVNMIPFPTLGIICQDISMPKLFRSKTTNRYLSFSEIMQSDISTYRYASHYTKEHILIEENSAEDILAATIEMFDRLDGRFVDSIEDKERHRKYMALLEPKHYSYGAGSSIFASFLRRYESLIS